MRDRISIPRLSRRPEATDAAPGYRVIGPDFRRGCAQFARDRVCGSIGLIQLIDPPRRRSAVEAPAIANFGTQK